MTTTMPEHVRTILFNRVPEVTIAFWVIKILSTTTGETFADYLNVDLGLGLTLTTWIMGALLIVALIAQFATKRYTSGVYWTVVVLISIVGTLLTDNLTDVLGRRALGQHDRLHACCSRSPSASGSLGSAPCRSTRSSRAGARPSTGSRSCSPSRSVPRPATSSPRASGSATCSAPSSSPSLIGVVVIARFVFNVNVVFCFWAAYILTRPLGASIGDLLSQDPADGGLGLGTTITSVVFLVDHRGSWPPTSAIKVARQRAAASAESATLTPHAAA